MSFKVGDILNFPVSGDVDVYEIVSLTNDGQFFNLIDLSDGNSYCQKFSSFVNTYGVLVNQPQTPAVLVNQPQTAAFVGSGTGCLLALLGIR